MRKLSDQEKIMLMDKILKRYQAQNRFFDSKWYLSKLWKSNWKCVQRKFGQWVMKTIHDTWQENIIDL